MAYKWLKNDDKPSSFTFKLQFSNLSLPLSFCSGVDILKLVAAHVGTQWIDIYQSLANATEREVAAFSNGYSSDHERAYAALQHWTIRDGDANLAKLINALHRQRRIDVVEKIRCVMEDNPQVGRMDDGTLGQDVLILAFPVFKFD